MKSNIYIPIPMHVYIRLAYVEPEKDNTHANRIRLLKRAGLLFHSFTPYFIAMRVMTVI